jgi:hypothetical protein
MNLPRLMLWPAIWLMSLASIGCYGQRTLDGSNPDALAASITAVARTLPEDARADFMKDLTTIAEEEGTFNLERPSIEALVALDGKTPEMLREKAHLIRVNQKKRRDAHQLELAQTELSELTARLQAAQETLDKIDAATSLMSLVTIRETVATADLHDSAGMTLQFQLMNRSKVSVTITGVEMTVKHLSGLTDVVNETGMLATSMGCLHGRTIEPETLVSVTCKLRSRYEPDARYSMRVTSIRAPGLDSTFLRLRADAIRGEVTELTAKRLQKQGEVNSLNKLQIPL